MAENIGLTKDYILFCWLMFIIKNKGQKALVFLFSNEMKIILSDPMNNTTGQIIGAEHSLILISINSFYGLVQGKINNKSCCINGNHFD